MPEASNQQYHTLREDSMREMNVTTIIDDGAVSGRQKLLFLFCGLTMLVDGFDAQAMGYAAPAVIRDLGLTKGQLAPIFSIGLLGIAVGNFLLGSLSDKYGRKTVLLWSLVSFGLLTIAKAYATTESHFLVLQFLAGLGIGAAYPNALSLAGEYAPERIRSMTVTSCGMGYLVGTFLGGLIAAFVIPRWGWQSVFIIGGVAALLVAAGAAFGVVESVKQLAAVRAPADTIRRTLAVRRGIHRTRSSDTGIPPWGAVRRRTGRLHGSHLDDDVHAAAADVLYSELAADHLRRCRSSCFPVRTRCRSMVHWLAGVVAGSCKVSA